jgi:hypothetical protein
VQLDDVRGDARLFDPLARAASSRRSRRLRDGGGGDERGNLLVAEATARELPRISLAEALELTLLIARKDPRRHPRVHSRVPSRLGLLPGRRRSLVERSAA